MTKYGTLLPHMTVDKKELVYHTPILGVEKATMLRDYVKEHKIKRVDLTQTTVSDKLLPIIYEMQTSHKNCGVYLTDTVQEKYQRYMNGGLFEKLRDPESYMLQVLTTSKYADQNWLVYEDLSQEDGLKYIVEVLDYGGLLGGHVTQGANQKRQRTLRYRRLKSYLAQPILLYNYIQDNQGQMGLWELGEWTWDEMLHPDFGLHPTSTLEEFYTVELIRAVLDGKVVFN